MAAGMDEDTVRTLQSGRETLGDMFGAARRNLQVVFIIWVAVLVGTISVFQNFLWDVLKRDLLYAKMGLELSREARIIAVTPFDVILLQVKIGVVLGIIVILPILVYLAREPLKERGIWPEGGVARWKLWTIGVLSLLLFAGGVAYAYELFFPIMFEFLAGNAVSADFKPHYSINKWMGFVLLLALSFGMAAQMPLVMSGLSYTGIVPYETFRNRWKWAVVGIFSFGALFSPPDPFTQVMWAMPLCGLYAISLGISKLLVMAKRAGETVGVATVAKRRWNKLAAAAVLLGGATYYIVVSPLFRYIKQAVGTVSTQYRPDQVLRPDFFGIGVEPSAALLAAAIGLVAALVVLYYYMVKALDAAAAQEDTYGDPSALDIEPLSAAAVRAAPPEPFVEMSEEEALQHAQQAMDADDAEKAEAILDRWDETADMRESEDADAEGDAAEGEADGEDGDVITRTTAGIFDSFTEDETTEDDVGGYYYDIAFIFDSLTSKAIWFLAVFMIVGGGTFVFLYAGVPGQNAAIAENASVANASNVTVADNVVVTSRHATLVDQNNSVVARDAVVVAREGSVASRPEIAAVYNDSTIIHRSVVRDRNGTVIAENATILVQDQTDTVTRSGIGIIKNAFVSGLPPEMAADVSFITLHPVEHLIFIVKFSTILGAFAVLPMLLYVAWPPLRERDWVRGDRRTLLYWGGSLFATLVVGSLVGFLYIAPGIISWLAYDVLQAGMVISYRVAKFGWLVLALTLGVGVFLEIPITMVLFHRGGIVSFQTVYEHWRPVTLGVFLAGAMLSPKGIWTMFLVAVPLTAAFLLGLGILWVYTLGGRRAPNTGSEPAD